MKRLLINDGDRYGNWTIIKESSLCGYDKKGYPLRKFKCKCICGVFSEIYLGNLIRRKETGKDGVCYHQKLKIGLKIRHSLSRTDLYKRWAIIKTRCYNKNREHYKYYGGKGVVMCDEWGNDFMSFYNWSINNGFKKELELDRIMSDGNYEPSNCRCVTHLENCNNIDHSKRIKCRG